MESKKPQETPLGVLPFANQVIESCDSTNRIAKQMAEQGAPHGTWISSKIQEAGRGRLGRKWESLEGNLFLSIIARLEDRAPWSWIPLTTAVGVTEGLKALFPELEIQIKWPNDLWFNQAKLGGILCEGVVRGESSYCIIGIGINCSQSPSSEITENKKSTDLTQARGGILTSADLIRLPLVTAVLRSLEILSHPGPALITQSYENRCALPTGTRVEWGNPICSGTVMGLGEAGELWVTPEDGKSIRLFAEDLQVKLRPAPSLSK